MDLQLETSTSDCRHPLGVIGIFGLDDLAANSYHAHDVNSIEYLCDNENNGTIWTEMSNSENLQT